MEIVYTIPKQGDAGFEEKCKSFGITAISVVHAREFSNHPGAGLYIDANFDGYFSKGATPLLFHAPAPTFEALTNAPDDSARFCAWPGFWERTLWEIAPNNKGVIDWNELLALIGVNTRLVQDISGLIAPRILCTLINEAVITVSQGVSGEQEVDTAMKLGTNYPLGPLEWAKRIGWTEVFSVLEAMSKENKKYTPHPNLGDLLIS